MKKSLLIVAVVLAGMMAVASAQGPPNASNIDQGAIAVIGVDPSVKANFVSGGNGTATVAGARYGGGSGGITGIPDGDGITRIPPNERMLN